MPLLQITHKLVPSIFTSKVPTVVKGVGSQWPALRQWSFQYLLENSKVGTAQHFFSFNERSQRLRSKQSSLIEAFTKLSQSRNKEDPLYLSRQPLTQSSLLNSIKVPPAISNARYHHPFLWCGTHLSITPLHYDSVNGFLCQIRGRKKIFIMPPDQSIYLYPHSPLTSGRFNFSEINCLHNTDMRSYDGLLYAQIETLVLEPGDGLFLPAGWWHQIYNLDRESIAVNSFFTDNLNCYNAKQEILMQQACNTYPQELATLMNVGHYFQCYENAVALAKRAEYRSAMLYMMTYLEEYIKAHLLQTFLKTLQASEAQQTKKLLIRLFDISRNDIEDYYSAIIEANTELSSMKPEVALSHAELLELVGFMKNLLCMNHDTIIANEVVGYIDWIHAHCQNGVYQPDCDFSSLYDSQPKLKK